jgi:hypothetical protein
VDDYSSRLLDQETDIPHAARNTRNSKKTRGLEDSTKEVTEERPETKLVHTLGTSSLGSSSSTSTLQQKRVPAGTVDENAKI